MILPVLIWASPGSVPMRAAGTLSLVFLAAWWAWGYQRGAYPARLTAFEGLALLVVAVGIGMPARGLGIFFVALYFRTTYGSAKAVIITVIAFLVAYCGGQAATYGPAVGQVLRETVPPAIGFPLTGIVMHVLATSLVRLERTAQREQNLAQARAALVAATSLRLGLRGDARGGSRPAGRDVHLARVHLTGDRRRRTGGGGRRR
jgi:hypothetical protein